MRLSADLFAIDCDAVVPRIEAFIRETMRSLSRAGIVVPLSGGLDSSTVAALCARAVGPDRVTGLMLPDRRGSPEALRYGRTVARHLGIRARVIDITRLLRAAGGYRSATNLVPSRRLLAWIVRKRLAASGGNPFLDAVRGSDRGVVRRTLASAYVKQRARVLAKHMRNPSMSIDPLR